MDLRLGVGGIVDLGSVVPVAGFLGLRVLDHLGGQHVPVVLQGAGLHLLVVDPHLVRLVWIQDQRVQVGELVVLEREGTETGSRISGNLPSPRRLEQALPCI